MCSELLEQDPVLKIIGNYRTHLSTKLIKAKINSQIYKFNQANIEKVRILALKITSQKVDIKTNQFGKNVVSFIKYIFHDINALIQIGWLFQQLNNRLFVKQL